MAKGYASATNLFNKKCSRQQFGTNRSGTMHDFLVTFCIFLIQRLPCLMSQISDSLQTLSSLIMHSQEDNHHLNDKLSSIATEYSNLETCVQRESLDPA